jgi:hypothetical protein
MKILLLDMDGVLLEPRGYHWALQDTVALVGRLLGYKKARLTTQDIAAFEAAGVSNEWDSSAICAALMLERLWSQYPGLTLPSTLASPRLPTHDIPAPDFAAFIRSLSQAHLVGMPPLRRAERLFLQDTDLRSAEQRQAIRDILHGAHQIDGSLTHRVFQELVLGSQVFAQTYGLASSLDTGSYLLQFDRATLSEQTRAELLSWLDEADHRAVIFTNRPSHPVGGHFCTPEAEIGARGIGVEVLPILGLGGLFWLGAQRGLDLDALRKPAPIHALAALRLALGDTLEVALEAAATLALDGQADRRWSRLTGAHVYVFEDVAGGLKSTLAAGEILAQIEVAIQLHLFGITENELKRQALEAVGAIVSPTLAMALNRVPGFGHNVGLKA